MSELDLGVIKKTTDIFDFATSFALGEGV